MKKSYLVIISVMSVLFLMGAKDSRQVSDSLSGLEEFLSSWVETTENLEKKIDALDERIEKESKAKEDLLNALSNIEKHLDSMNERIVSVERLSTFFSELPTETLGKTLRFYNESIAELKKQIESQQVSTAVLEKKYQEAQRPLEPVKKEVAEVRKSVIDVSQKVDKNLVLIEDIQNNLQSTIVDTISVTLEEYEKVFTGLSKKIEHLEENAGITATEEEEEEEAVAEDEEGARPGRGEVVKAGESEEEEKGKEAAESATEAPPKKPEEEGYQDIGLGFYIRNVEFKRFGSSTSLIGELRNESNRDYSIAPFTIKVYNPDDSLLGSDDFSITGFKNGEVRKFRQIITGVEPKKIYSYSITFKKSY